MFTRRKVHAFAKGNIIWMGVISLILCLPKNVTGASSFTNYQLPSSAGRAPVKGAKLNYKTKRFQLKGKFKLVSTKVDSDDFLFAKQAFLAERRDRAIKLLRQELDVGYKVNRSNMLLRLGQMYAEKYMELSYLENQIFTEQLKTFEKSGKNKRKPPRLNAVRSKSYLKRALGLFHRLEKKYPRHPNMDEILFFIGFVKLESGKGKVGSRYLERVVRKYPRSKKFDEAVLYLGDYYFLRHRFKAAAAKFSILLRRRNSRLHHYSRYKIAWCYLNTGQKRRGLNLMKKLIASLEDSEEKAKFNLRKQALLDLVVFYGEIGAIKEAYAFYKEHTSKEEALRNVRLLGDILRSKALDREAIAAYELLLDEDPDNVESPLIQLGIYESLARMGRSSRAIKHLAKAIHRYGATSDFAKDFPKEKKRKLQEMLLRLQKEGYKVATFHHHAAQKGTNRIHFEYAATLYRALEVGFPNHPEKKKIAFYQAEVLYARKAWLEAANAYMRASKIPPKDKLADESVYNALLALDHLTVHTSKIERIKKGKSIKKRDISKAENRFIEVANFYLKEYPKGRRIVHVKFRIAAIYYYYKHLDKALVGFKNIAINYPKHKSAVTSAHLVLDIYNLNKDYDNLGKMAALFASRKRFGGKGFRREMLKIQDEIRFKRIESLEKTNKWSDAGTAYLDVFNKNPKSSLAKKSLHNAVISFEKAKDQAKFESTARKYLKKYAKTKEGQRLTLMLGKMAEKKYDYATAISYYLRYYDKYPRSSEARKTLYNSAVFSELLGRNSKAIRLYDRYLRLGKLSNKSKNTIYISQANLYAKQRNWDQVNRIYRRMVARTKSIPMKVNYLAELARKFEKGKRRSQRTQVLKEILWFYKSVKGRGIEGFGLKYVAEMMYLSINKRKKSYESIRLKFPPTELVRLMKRKQSRLNRLTKEYDKVISVGVPEWGVAAAYAKAQAYLHYVKVYRAVKIPRRYNKAQKTEAKSSLAQIDKEAVVPLENLAQSILDKCVENARKYSVANTFAAKCHRKSKTASKLPTPGGLLPRPSYWSTRPLSQGVATR